MIDLPRAAPRLTVAACLAAGLGCVPNLALDADVAVVCATDDDCPADFECRATIGEIGNAEHENIVAGKAGRKRWMGVRPTVRGTTMNPVDHPHGGGEGSTPPGRSPVTPWGVPTLGHKTRKSKKGSDKYIIRRRGEGR